MQQDIPNLIVCREYVPEVLRVRRFVLDQDPTAVTHKTDQTAKRLKLFFAWQNMQGLINANVVDPRAK